MSNSISRPYAKAAFDFALENNKVDIWFDSLSTLSNVINTKEVMFFINNPKIDWLHRCSILLSVFDREIDESICNFLKLLMVNHRLTIIRDIYNEFSRLKLENENRQAVIVYSANKLSNDQIDMLKGKLEKKLSKHVSIICKEDKNLISGIKIIYGDKVIDRSMSYALKKMKEYL